MKESDETPAMEARSHSKGFLKKAANMKMKSSTKKMPFGKRPGASVATPQKNPFAKGK